MKTRFAKKKWRASNSLFLLITLLLGGLILNGCAFNQSASLPPISPTPTGEHRIGTFVWFDLLTEDVQKAQSFYTGLFGWRLVAAANTKDYTVIYANGKPIGGIAPYKSKDPDVLESIWLASLSVENVDRAVSEVKARNGELLDGPLNVRGRGRVAVVRDPEGAELVLIRSEGGDPIHTRVDPGEWLWVDLFTRDARKAITFYEALAGYTVETVTIKGDAYKVLRRDGRPQAGIVELPWDDVEPNWLPYIKVDDLETTILQAKKLGGGVILRLENIAVIEDPAGAVFGIQMVREN